MNVLAIDGGGVRGVVPAVVLANWETDSNRPTQDRFGLFAGTSTGAIVAGSLAAGISGPTLLELFRSDTAAIFTPQREGFVKRALSFKGIVLPAYSLDPLRKSLETNLGDRTLGDCPHPLIISALDVVSGNPKIFRSGHFPDGQNDRTVRMVDAILASTAAPVLFPSIPVGVSAYIDGSLWANNPSILAMLEANKLHQDPPNILSLGCGRPLWGGKLGFGGNRGLLGWSLPLVSLLMTAQADGVAHYMDQLVPAGRYMRINPVLPRHLAQIDRAESVPELIARASEAAREALPRLNERFA